MSVPQGLLPGDLIVFEQRSAIGGVYAEHNVARIDLIGLRHVTVFPWRMGDRKWDRRRFRVLGGQVIAALPQDADVAAVAEDLNRLRNERDLQRAAAQRRYVDRVHRQLRQAAAKVVR